MCPQMNSENLKLLKEELRELARSMGAADARVATKEMMEGPPSGDPTYVFPDARSVVAFAMPLGTDYIEDYLGKKTRMVFKRVLYEKYQLVGGIGAPSPAESGRRVSGRRVFHPMPSFVLMKKGVEDRHS